MIGRRFILPVVLCLASVVSVPLRSAPFGVPDESTWGKIKNQSSVPVVLQITDRALPVGKIYIKEYGTRKKDVKLSSVGDRISIPAGKTYIAYFDTTGGIMGLTFSIISGTEEQKANVKKIMGGKPVVAVYLRKKKAKIIDVKYKSSAFNKFSKKNSFIYITDLGKPPKPAAKDPEPEDTAASTDVAVEEPAAGEDE
ncbi:MAG: hypothetical protein P4L36_03040 [Holophaga sp.]|nr:hypothetical protein [Holophaga sp.]